MTADKFNNIGESGQVFHLTKGWIDAPTILIMRVGTAFYPIEASGTKSLVEEAKDHGELNSHVDSIEDINGNRLWKRK